MQIREVQFDLIPYLEARFGHAPRSVGLHVSQVYGDLDRILNAKRYKGDLTETQLSMFGNLGFLWERVLSDALSTLTLEYDPARYYRPEEMEHEGMFLTPDYADLDFLGDGSGIMGLEEWKVSWKSVNAWDDMEKNFWRWLVQMKAYCHVLGIRQARMRVLFIVGDWRDDISPKCKCREFIFTEQELQENWDMLKGHAKRKGWLL